MGVRNDILSPIALLLCFAFLSMSARPLLGQAPPAPQQLQIVVLDSGTPGTAGTPMVQVQDENHQPVRGALVVFTAPSGSGEFTNGGHSLTVVTNQQGRAMATGFRPNTQTGEFVLEVLATFAGRRAETTIRRTNVSATATPGEEEPGKGPGTQKHIGKWIAIVGLVAGAALVGGFAARGGGGSGGSSGSPSTGPSAPTAPAPAGVTITPGTGTVVAAPK